MKKSLLALAITLTATGSWAETDKIDHSTMDHSNMNHSQMEDHSQMEMPAEAVDHSSMDHSQMDATSMAGMPGMTAVGMPAPGAKPDKVVHVILSDDMKITFKQEGTIKPNDVVQFVVMNTGKIDHEFAIGSIEEMLEHREMMKTMADHNHEMSNAVTVKAGKAQQLLWHFHGATQVQFACNIPGHTEAGMVKNIQL
ncbi:hypothetical protein K6Y31_03290 [Motilimonas cestriensis]|uniref:Copper-binding protein n=1 Tax=Motilimonas cestriensis TaxID=2742685 RepID=A0ABS8W4E7_9GAMM|nr:hypothetical protein [Motilimonas cestriensis]MCE2593834.1 hypothetical protein [Motilimonas cestriensis]